MPTHTYVLLDVSDDVYNEIAAKLLEAGYDHAFHKQDDGRVALDMHGIALLRES